jgi:CheY-like chemotaxis protein
MPPVRGVLRGRKIMVVEDNYLIAEHVRGLLLQEGCEVVGPAGRLAQALEIVGREDGLDGAVLDINLDGQRCFPVAAALDRRAVPFVFLTGYDDPSIIPAVFADRPMLPKPLDEARLIEVASMVFAAHGTGRGP